MSLTRISFLLTASLMHASTAFAADTLSASPTGGLLQMLSGLIVVLLLMGVAAWLFRRIGPAALGQRLPMKIVGGLNISNRERVLVVEVADQWLVLGVTATQINTLATLQKQDLPAEALAANQPPFAAWLAQALNKNKQAPK